jgi:peptide/nickel transport system ATP-binding protein
VLGGDTLGRDVWSRLLDGGQVLLALAAISTILGVGLGATTGMVAGYYGKWRDSTLMRSVDVLLAFPGLVLALLLLSVAGPHVWLIVLAITLAQAPQVARVMRSATLRLSGESFVEAVEMFGIPRRQILRKEILPNLVSPLMVELGLRFTYSLLGVAALGFLGFGLPPPAPNWGAMINENRLGLVLNPWATVAPAVLLVLLTVGVNTLTDAVARSALSGSPPRAGGRQPTKVARRADRAAAHGPEVTRDEGASNDSAPVAPAVVEVRHLTVSVADSAHTLVDDVSFSVGPGEVLGLVGESGSGKTTIALSLLGYARRGLTLASGSVNLHGQDLLSVGPSVLRELRGKRVAYVPQDPTSALNPARRVGWQLADALIAHRRRPMSGGENLQQRVDEALRSVDLDPSPTLLRSFPHQLSGGQQQRVAIAMAFVWSPALIVLDEPTTGLDVTTQREVLATVTRLCVEGGTAAVYVSHDLAVVHNIADRVAVMYAGRLVEIGTVEAVLDAPGHPYTRALVRAVPALGDRRPPAGIEGQPPQVGWQSPGCAFAPRCPIVVEQCAAAVPELVAVDTCEHRARCFRAGAPDRPVRVEPSRRVLVPLDRRHGRAGLVISGLTAHYGGRTVLHDVGAVAGSGECLAVVGESGSGKTTLARCIVGLHQTWEGHVQLGEDVLSPSPGLRDRALRRRVQLVFQNPFSSLNPRKTVAEILDLPIRHFFDEPARERHQRIVGALDAVGLGTELLHRRPDRLSGGQRQRVAIARALVCEPDLLVCDEVTASLDVSVQALVVGLLTHLQRQRHLTMVFITHNLALVASLAQQVVVLSDGRMVEHGSVTEVLTDPVNETTRRLLEDVPRLNHPGQQPAQLSGEGA